MGNNIEKISKNMHPFRNTVLVRISCELKNEVERLSLEKHRTISKILDEAVQEYLLSVKRQNDI
jgi:predicted DNA-binding protein